MSETSVRNHSHGNNKPFKKRQFLIDIFTTTEEDREDHGPPNLYYSTCFRLRSFPTVWNLSAEVKGGIFRNDSTRLKRFPAARFSPILSRWKGYINLFHVCNPHLMDNALEGASNQNATSESISIVSSGSHDRDPTFTRQITLRSPKTCLKPKFYSNSKLKKSAYKVPDPTNGQIPFHSNQCRICKRSYSTSWELKVHVNTHTLPFDCSHCGKCFSRPWLLRGHLRTHTGEKPFKCGACERAFADKSNLRAHQQTHAAIKKHMCSSCFKSFSRASLLRNHGADCHVRRINPVN